MGNGNWLDWIKFLDMKPLRPMPCISHGYYFVYSWSVAVQPVQVRLKSLDHLRSTNSRFSLIVLHCSKKLLKFGFYKCSISFPNEPLISWTFLGHFCHHFWVGATAKQQQTHPKVMTKMVKKCSTDQRFIRKRNTTYKIGTLVST